MTVSTTSPKATSSSRDAVQSRLRHDVATLVGLDRRTLGEGERRAADHLRASLTQLGAQQVEGLHFRSQSSWAPAHLAHIAAAVLAAALPHRLARAAGIAVGASYELEVSGRRRWVGDVLPGATGTSVSARVPASGTPTRVVVLVAHLDAAHTGLVWDRRAVAFNRWLARHTSVTVPSHLIPLSAMTIAAIGSRRIRAIASGVLIASGAMMIQSMHSPTAPGANDNATGVAAILEIARHFAQEPLPDTEIRIVFPGGEEAGNAGIRRWIQTDGQSLDPASTLVINLDAVGSHGAVGIARREALTNRPPSAGVRRAHAAARELGIDARDMTVPNATDAALLSLTGLETISILSADDGWISNLHTADDTPANVSWTTVTDAVRLVRQIVTTWSAT
ncbi:M20/M25/M40 family metallo-hydrolase [Gordonia sp. ABSL1-1]|uniref:M20/M25/M40 family metallo-hydrolase n=1 Tax=Gordonia sp. ABSL1-1 TaxID=3053923 RepID=UPI002573145C|nr:M20/M25/M40 family metallo-hydrolase [Gordonia sp. ABSL1-1]MDL9935949.1 M20/M25/M40 family metallo-hydrolase [Gordonia sp. ABSL1-1]